MKTRRFGSRRGNAMVEFALGATVLVFAFSGVFQFGYSFYLYNELEGAVRMGVRYASLQKVSNSGDDSVPSTLTTAIKNVVVYGTPSPANTDSAVVTGLGVGNINVAYHFTNHVPDTVTVSISSYALNAIFTTYTISGKPILKMPYFGSYCASGPTC
jgi:Flp pilus assembly protein TadG